jgi:hypothetical protein
MIGGPIDGQIQPCPLFQGFLPHSFEPALGGGEYVLAATVTHAADGSLCGGRYLWAPA